MTLFYIHSIQETWTKIRIWPNENLDWIMIPILWKFKNFTDIYGACFHHKEKWSDDGKINLKWIKFLEHSKTMIEYIELLWKNCQVTYLSSGVHCMCFSSINRSWTGVPKFGTWMWQIPSIGLSLQLFRFCFPLCYLLDSVFFSIKLSIINNPTWTLIGILKIILLKFNIINLIQLYQMNKIEFFYKSIVFLE